ncbi:MAG: hypothetical protein Q3990_00370 [Desulfovibrionaceae bacterium]|nr:hypothetical protein [Desulfovibrionaceae bacterium]
MNRSFSIKKCAAMMLTLCLAMPLAGCESSGPKGACDRAASALEKKDSALFMSQFDMDAYAYHEFVNLSKDNGLMKLTDQIGSIFGINDQLNSIIMNATNLKGQTEETFKRSVANGEMAAICSRSTSADCPWDVTGLKNAKIKELNEEAAIATVTTKANVTSWVALRKKGETWVIVGKAASEEKAAMFATDQKGMPKAPEEQKEPVFPGKEAPADTEGEPQAGTI